MIFGEVPVEEAAGAILAHSVRLPTGRLRKGRWLVEVDVAALRAAGIGRVTVARLGPEDVHEDEAARRVAEPLAGPGLHLSAPFTGRANLFADAAGLLRVDRERVDRLNALHPAITLATLDDHARVQRRQMVATVKIIPYAAPADAVAKAERLLAAPPTALEARPFAPFRASLILTRTPGLAPKLVDKGREAVADRVTALGGSLGDVRVVDHRVGPLGAALTDGRGGEAGDPILLLTGSATSDEADTGPAAVVAAGGRIARFGMPVDPGNLLFLGELRGRTVVGLPGCARAPALNGADWVLERLAAGIVPTSADIAGMGVGGLLKEIASRPAPRVGEAPFARRPRVSAIVLAAGASSRMRGRDKLLERVGGRPLLARVVETAARSGADDVTVVLRPGDMARREALAGLDAGVVLNPRAEAGMGTSIAAGIAALGGRRSDGALILLADMPDIEAGDIDRLIAAFDPGEGRAIVRAEGGHPVLFGRRFFEALAALDGDRGAKAILEEHAEFVTDVALVGDRATVDLDTPEDWAAWRARG